MSTTHFPKVLDFHSRGTGASKRPIRPKRTEISSLYQSPGHENTTLGSNPHIHIEPANGDVLSLDLLNQYNDIVGSTESLAFKRLPPVKVSYQSTKHKFIESPNVEGTSRIIRPHLSMKTYSPGHHIFTEGISRSSIVRSPTFALQEVKVPYSNLPDSISVYKEKDKFAFGVNSDEYEKSPYRLTPKPFKVGSATFIPSLEADSSKHKNEKSSKNKRGSKSSTDKPILELKSNVIKLQPLASKDDKTDRHGQVRKPEIDADMVKVPQGFAGRTKSPMVSSNSFYIPKLTFEWDIDTESKQSKIETELENKSLKTENSDRKLSVVSIGETVGPTYYDNKKKEARQLYPMYDDTTRRNENYRKKKFEYSEDFTFKAKSQLPSSTFMYKVSTQGMAFNQDRPGDLFRPIKNNLRDRYGNPIHKQRGLGKHDPSSIEEDNSTRSSDYNFRRYYRRVFRRPKSSDSHSTEFSQLPGNPPPSEISHIFSEDAPILVNDMRNGMVTLMEERTMTEASMMSPRKENTPRDEINGSQNITKIAENEEKDELKDTGQPKQEEEISDTCTDTDVQFEKAIKNVERNNEHDIETSRTDISKSTRLESSVSAAIDKQKLEHADSRGDNSVVERYIAEAEEKLKTITALEEEGLKQINVDLTTGCNKTLNVDSMDMGQANKITSHGKSKSNLNMKCLPVPTFSLDSVNQKSTMPISKERTSLSRSIQNMTVPDESNNRHVSKKTKSMEDLAPDSMNRTLPITRLKLFSAESTMYETAQVIETDVAFNDAEIHEAIDDDDLNDSKMTDNSTREKKIVSHANVPFIYPATSEVKAKRQ